MVKNYVVELTSEERMELVALTEKKKIDSKRMVKAFVLLRADAGWLDEAIVSAYGISLRTVERIRERFVEEGLEGLEGLEGQVVDAHSGCLCSLVETAWEQQFPVKSLRQIC